MYVKNPFNQWIQSTAVYVKNPFNQWAPVKKMFVKVANAWQQFYPTSGPYTDQTPYFSSSSSNLIVLTTDNLFLGTMPNPNQVAGSGNVYVANKVYGYSGDWNPNSYTISGFTYNVYGYSAASGGTKTTLYPTGSNSNTLSAASSVNYPGDKIASIIPSFTFDLTYDNQYLVYEVKTTSTVVGIDNSESHGRIHITKNPPVNISSQITGLP